MKKGAASDVLGSVMDNGNAEDQKGKRRGFVYNVAKKDTF